MNTSMHPGYTKDTINFILRIVLMFLFLMVEMVPMVLVVLMVWAVLVVSHVCPDSMPG